MTESEREYLLLRADAELKAATQADCPQAERTHAQLAGYYLDRAHGARVDDPADAVEANVAAGSNVTPLRRNRQTA